MKKKAFTLVELIISMAIISIIIILVNSIIKLNFNIATKSYKDDKDYKDINYAILYIENVIRSADKIESYEGYGSNFCNFKAYVFNNDGNYSTYRFFLKKSGDLLVNIDNLTSGKEGYESNNKLSHCKNMKITYDENKNGVSIEIQTDFDENYKSYINLEKRL